MLLVSVAVINLGLAEAGSPAPAEKPLPVFANAHNDYEHDYPLLEEHTLQHHGFREKVARLSVATAEGHSSVPHELLSYLQQWLIHHILQSDMEFKPFFGQKGVR